GTKGKDLSGFPFSLVSDRSGSGGLAAMAAPAAAAQANSATVQLAHVFRPAATELGQAPAATLPGAARDAHCAAAAAGICICSAVCVPNLDGCQPAHTGGGGGRPIVQHA